MLWRPSRSLEDKAQIFTGEGEGCTPTTGRKGGRKADGAALGNCVVCLTRAALLIVSVEREDEKEGTPTPLSRKPRHMGVALLIFTVRGWRVNVNGTTRRAKRPHRIYIKISQCWSSVLTSTAVVGIYTEASVSIPSIPMRVIAVWAKADIFRQYQCRRCQWSSVSVSMPFVGISVYANGSRRY